MKMSEKCRVRIEKCDEGLVGRRGWRKLGKRVVRWRGIADFGQFDRSPGSPAGEGNVGINDGEIIALGQTNDVFIVQVMSENAGDGVEVGEVTVVEHTVVDELDGRKTHRDHEISGLGLGDERAGGIYLDVGLGNHRGEFLVLGVDRESFQPIGGLGKEHGMEAHPNEVIAERAVIDAVVEALDPTAGLRIVVNLMFGSAAFSLSGPELEEVIFVEHVTEIVGPFP
jgi:hypothetical protein